MSAELIVLVPSRKRPQAAAELLAEAGRTSTASAKMFFAVDADDPTLDSYRGAIPSGNLWITPATQRGSVAATNWAFENVLKHLSGLFAIGLMGDDVRPRTEGWDAKILEALRELGTGIVYGDDLIQGKRLPTHPFMTADIPRALGWLGLPTLKHLYVDNVLLELGKAADRIRYLPDVVLEHLHPVAGKASWDQVYQETSNKTSAEDDRRTFEAWRHSAQFRIDVAKLKALSGPSLPATTSLDIVHPKQRRLRIAVYSVAKDEEKHARRWADSAGDADVRLVADTGSSDRTAAILAECGVDVRSISVQPFRFDVARNTALAMLPADINVCVSLDLDEVLSPGWREVIERRWKPCRSRMQHWFVNGNQEYTLGRIHGRQYHIWKWPVHEYVMCTRNEKPVDVGQQLTITHLPDRSKPRTQYLKMLERAVREDRCSRMLWCLAREYKEVGNWKECIKTTESYLAHPDSTWKSERATAMRWVAEGMRAQNKLKEAYNWLVKASQETPDARDPWCALAQLHHDCGHWSHGYEAALKALAIANREKHFLVQSACWGSYPHDLASICAWQLGRKEEAVRHLQDALQLDPGNERLTRNAAFMCA